MVAAVKIGHSNWAGRVKKMIVFEYFLMGKRTYNEIVTGR